MKLTEFVNGTEMVSFSAFLRAIGWFIAVLTFTVTSCVILLRDGEEYMTWGLQLALAVIGGLLGGSVVGAFSNKVVRETSEKYAPVAEAKERGKVAGAAAAVAIREQVLDAKAARANGSTKEHPAIQADNVERMVVKTELPKDDERGTE
jgi:Zn-dependent protease